MSLRDEAITHMAQAINDMIAINIGGELGQVPDAHRGKEAAAALDALLDFLDTHTELLEDHRPEIKRLIRAAVKGDDIDMVTGAVMWQFDLALAALRGTTEEGET